MSKEVDHHNIENQKIREEFEGMLRSFDKLIEENRKKKLRIEELLVNKALLEKNIADLEKGAAEASEDIAGKKDKIEKLQEAKRELEMKTGVIPELKEQIGNVGANRSSRKTSRTWRTKTGFWTPTTSASAATPAAT